MYGSTISDSNNDCVGVTTKLYNKESNSATAACTAFHSSNVAPSGLEFCGSSFQSLIKVCNLNSTPEFVLYSIQNTKNETKFHE